VIHPQGGVVHAAQQEFTERSVLFALRHRAGATLQDVLPGGFLTCPLSGADGRALSSEEEEVEESGLTKHAPHMAQSL
jgi:hypothetical protein